MTPETIRAARRIVFTVSRGKITLVDDTGVIQKHQVDYGPQGPDGSLGLRDNTPMMSIFGFTSNPPLGADVVSLFVGGDRSNGVSLGNNHQPSRLTGLQPGDSAQYDVRGAYVKLTEAGLTVDAAGNDVVLQNYGTVTVMGGTVIVQSDDVSLGDTGGPAVARVGDSVSGGVITSGSSKVTCA
jgi:phage gp45-like